MGYGRVGDQGDDVMKKNNQEVEKAKAEDVRICALCGRTIIGDYDYIQTRRGTEMYFCKGMKCRKGNKNEKRD